MLGRHYYSQAATLLLLFLTVSVESFIPNLCFSTRCKHLTFRDKASPVTKTCHSRAFLSASSRKDDENDDQTTHLLVVKNDGESFPVLLSRRHLFSAVAQTTCLTTTIAPRAAKAGPSIYDPFVEEEEEIPTAPFRPPSITGTSSKRALKLANELKSLNTKLYGAYWCSHCYDQKNTIGKEAFQEITYIECDREGINSQNALCKSKNIKGYPTWEIDGLLFAGQKDLAELEELVKQIKPSPSFKIW